MGFNFVETFTVEMPDFKEMNFSFAESTKISKGIIIEVAAIHERINRQLQ